MEIPPDHFQDTCVSAPSRAERFVPSPAACRDLRIAPRWPKDVTRTAQRNGMTRINLHQLTIPVGCSMKVQPIRGTLRIARRTRRHRGNGQSRLHGTSRISTAAKWLQRRRLSHGALRFLVLAQVENGKTRRYVSGHLVQHESRLAMPAGFGLGQPVTAARPRSSKSQRAAIQHGAGQNQQQKLESETRMHTTATT